MQFVNPVKPHIIESLLTFGNTAQRTHDGFTRHMPAYTNFPNNNSKPVGRNSICLCYPPHHTMSMLSSSALAYEISARHLNLLLLPQLTTEFSACPTAGSRCQKTLGNTAQRTPDGFARHMLAYTNFPNNNSKPVVQKFHLPVLSSSPYDKYAFVVCLGI